MKYSTKLYICFIALIFFTTSLVTGIIYHENRIFLFNELKSKVLSIASTIAALLDPNEIKEINSPNDIEKKAFKDLKEQLTLASNINKREDVYLINTYILRPSSDGSQNVEFIVDSTADPKAFALPGEKYLGEKDFFYNLRRYYVPGNFIEHNWGKVLSAYAPLYDSDGNYIATLGVDVSAEEINNKLWNLLLIGLLSMVSAILLSLIFAFIFSKIISNNLSRLKDDVTKIGKGDLDHKIILNTEDEFNDLAKDINQMTDGLRERDKIKLNFAKYVSGQVLEKILCSRDEIKVQGERKKVTLLFSDIPKFSNVAENLNPEGVVALLNDYFSKMLDEIVKYDGTIDKFIGEGIMVEFGAPIPDPNQELKAVQAAISMHLILSDLLKEWKLADKPHIDMCIGIHTGDAVVGNIGSDKRMEYTAIGDSVNIASRLVVLSKEKNQKILISEQVYEKVKHMYRAELIGKVRLTGKDMETTVFSIDPFQGKNT